MDGLKQGDIILTALPGDYGKPRPALVMQAKGLDDAHSSVIICPITSTLYEAHPMRQDVAPSKGNGLRKSSQLMVDKLYAIKGDRIKQSIGRLSAAEMKRLKAAVRTLLAL